MIDTQSPVWSVIILLCCGLAFTAWCVYTILKMSWDEMKE